MQTVRAGAASLLIVLFGTLGPSPSAQDAPISVEALGQGVFDALAAGSLDAFMPYLMTAEDFEEMVRVLATTPGPDGTPEISDAQRAEALAIKEALVSELEREVRSSFERSLDAGYDWPSATFVRVEVEIHTPDGDRTLDPATLAEEEHRAAEIAVVVSLKDDDRERTLDLRDCFRSDRGWVITERVSLLLSSPR